MVRGRPCTVVPVATCATFKWSNGGGGNREQFEPPIPGAERREADLGIRASEIGGHFYFNEFASSAPESVVSGSGNPDVGDWRSFPFQ